ncbi:MAG TPA: cytochrome c [Chitinophagales bacterium]|nr:cytochrome c [Chitinophagales bacterium]
MKKFLKILGILILIVGVGAGAFALYISIKGIPNYTPQDPGATVQSDSAKVENGKRLAEMLCKNCHWDPSTDKFTGRKISDPGLAQFGTLYSANITQDKQYGIADYTDGQILYLLRTGVKRNGGYAPPWMPKLPHMSDYDIKSVVAFLHSNDPWVTPGNVADTLPTPSFLAKFLANFVFKPLPYPDHPVPQPDTTNKVEWGKYIVTGMLDCYPCHSADFKTMNMAEPEKSAGFMGGGNQVGDNADGQHMHSANLTPDKETGIGNWMEEDFVKAIRFGQKPDGKPIRLPMVPYPQLSVSEAKAIFAYLQTIPVIHNKVENPPQ